MTTEPVAPGDDHDHTDVDTDLPTRSLFRYLGASEWRDYRAILGVFAGTFFAEFTPDDVLAALDDAAVDAEVVPERLNQLRRWGNLTVSSSVGNPSSLDDYYRRRNRYLITRAGQEVFETVERLLSTATEVGDVEAGRLRTMLDALQAITHQLDLPAAQRDEVTIADASRRVFDEHAAFTTELTQFFAELNHWQSRYDLDADDVQFLAGVLVDYVGEQLTEIERIARPISRTLEQILPALDDVVTIARSGLAQRVDAAGLADYVSVRRQAGAHADDWHHLASWFTSAPGQPARLDQLTRQALAAVRTLTANLTRLSRVGMGATSRRADFVRLAGYFDRSTPDESHRIAAAAFGLGSVRHFAIPAADAEDPVATTTPWAAAPRAIVPISLRERGDAAQRGRATPIRDRRAEREMLRRRRELDRASAELVAEELIRWSHAGDGKRASLSMPAFAVVRDLVGRAVSTRRDGPDRSSHDERLRCHLRSEPGAATIIECAEGRLVVRDLTIELEPVDV